MELIKNTSDGKDIFFIRYEKDGKVNQTQMFTIE
jgi:hypothetical protein